MADDFPTLIGKVMHHCGALEFLANGAIKALSTDELLFDEIVKASFGKRIEVLLSLLRGRANLPERSGEDLCDRLSKIAQFRNQIAHNPVMSDKPSGTVVEKIIVVRHKAGRSTVKREIQRDDLRAMVTFTRETLEMFVKLLPASTSV